MKQLENTLSQDQLDELKVNKDAKRIDEEAQIDAQKIEEEAKIDA